MQQRDSRTAIHGSTALKLDTGLSSAHIIQFPGSSDSSRQVTHVASNNHAFTQSYSNIDTECHTDFQRLGRTEPKATPCQTAIVIILFTLLTIIAGIL